MFSHKQDSHFQAVPVKEKTEREKKRLRRAPGRALAQPPEVKAPSRAANPAPVPSTSAHSVESQAGLAAAPPPRPWVKSL